MSTATQRDRWCQPAAPGHWHMQKAKKLTGSEIYKMSIHMSLCLDARSDHSKSKEAVLNLLPAQTSETICDQDALCIKVLSQNINTEWLWLQPLCSLSIRVVGSISVYGNPLVYKQSVYKFLLINLWKQLLFAVPLLSWHWPPNLLKRAKYHDNPQQSV
jgi:hypothetical protein